MFPQQLVPELEVKFGTKTFFEPRQRLKSRSQTTPPAIPALKTKRLIRNQKTWRNQKHFNFRCLKLHQCWKQTWQHDTKWTPWFNVMGVDAGELELQSPLWECVCVSSLQPLSVSGVNTKRNIDANSFSVSNINSVSSKNVVDHSFRLSPAHHVALWFSTFREKVITNGEEQWSRWRHRWLKRERKNTGNAPATQHALIHPPPPLGM